MSLGLVAELVDLAGRDAGALNLLYGRATTDERRSRARPMSAGKFASKAIGPKAGVRGNRARTAPIHAMGQPRASDSSGCRPASRTSSGTPRAAAGIRTPPTLAVSRKTGSVMRAGDGGLTGILCR